jgi:hypothetical protein
MFLLDDILLAPLKGLTAVCRQVHAAAVQELENERKAVMAAMMELHKQLESSRISESGFEIEETRLLKRLEDIERTLNPDDQSEES